VRDSHPQLMVWYGTVRFIPTALW